MSSKKKLEKYKKSKRREKMNNLLLTFGISLIAMFITFLLLIAFNYEDAEKYPTGFLLFILIIGIITFTITGGFLL
jgi:uncharacterized integral membrane protein